MFNRGPGARIVLVDDDCEMLSMISDYLKDLGHTVYAYPLAQLAYDELLKDGVESILGMAGLVISDLNMPGMDGIELLTKIKSHRPELPVVLITAYGSKVREEEARRLGVHSLLSKPFKLSELAAILSELI